MYSLRVGQGCERQSCIKMARSCTPETTCQLTISASIQTQGWKKREGANLAKTQLIINIVPVRLRNSNQSHDHDHVSAILVCSAGLPPDAACGAVFLCTLRIFESCVEVVLLSESNCADVRSGTVSITCVPLKMDFHNTILIST